MRRVLAVFALLVSALLLSSCGLLQSVLPNQLPYGPGTPYAGEDEWLDARVQRIVDAVNAHSLTDLKGMFSQRAVEQDANLDEELTYFISIFPDGISEAERLSVSASENYSYGEQTESLGGSYKLTAGGKFYWLSLVDFTVNQVDDPENVGLYELGAVLGTASEDSSAEMAYFAWLKSGEPDWSGGPRIYVPAGAPAP